MADEVDWRSAYRAARWWVTPTTSWSRIQTSIKGPNLTPFRGKDCFYSSSYGEDYILEVNKISLDGSISNMGTFSHMHTLVVVDGLPFILPPSREKPFPVGHTISPGDYKGLALSSWESTPGIWRWNYFTVISPDGTSFPDTRFPVGVFRNEVVREMYSPTSEELVGHYHLILHEGRYWCRNLLASGLATRGKDIEEQFFLLPFELMARFLYSGGRLWVVVNEEKSWELWSSGLVQ